MSEKTDLVESARIRSLEGEVRALRQQLDQREELLKVLNRRLLQLERGESSTAGVERTEIGVLQDQLESLRATKLFRWSSPVRSTYARMRRLG